MNIFLLILAAFGGGALNAVAGGGSFLTFPALVFSGVPAVIANATSTVALLPGSFASAYSYRRGVATPPGISLRALVIVSIIGELPEQFYFSKLLSEYFWELRLGCCCLPQLCLLLASSSD